MKVIRPTVTMLDGEPEFPAYSSATFRFLSRAFPAAFRLAWHWYWYAVDPEYRAVIRLDKLLRKHTDRIDLLPEPSGERGFVLSLDRFSALYFVQDGKHFFYEGWSISGRDEHYPAGDPQVADAIREHYERREKENV